MSKQKTLYDVGQDTGRGLAEHYRQSGMLVRMAYWATGVVLVTALVMETFNLG